MSDCTNCDQVNDLWNENQKLKKAYDQVCAERDELLDRLLSIRNLINSSYGLKAQYNIAKEEFDSVCIERDRLKEENKSLYRACNILLAEQRGESEDESND